MNKAKVLLVDDDPVALKFFSVLLGREQDIELYKAMDVDGGITILNEEKPDMIISDYYMPGKDGFEFCQYVKAKPDPNGPIFILLTAEAEVAKKVQGLDTGADDYIEKTVAPSVFLSKVRAFLRIKSLQDELVEERRNLAAANEQLERNFRELVAIFLKIIEINVPGASDRAQVARSAAEYIAEKLGLDREEKRKIVFGATLHEIGKIGLPDRLVKEQKRNLSAPDRDVFNQYIVIGSMIIETISGFKDAARDVLHQLENFDGSGLPDGLMRNEISIGARIIRAIVFQEELYNSGYSTEEVKREIKEAINRILDPQVASELVQFLISNDAQFSYDKLKLDVSQLRPDMTVAEDIYSSSGVKLLPRGTLLQERLLQLLVERNDKDPIIGGVCVYKADCQMN